MKCHPCKSDRQKCSWVFLYRRQRVKNSLGWPFVQIDGAIHQAGLDPDDYQWAIDAGIVQQQIASKGKAVVKSGAPSLVNASVRYASRAELAKGPPIRKNKVVVPPIPLIASSSGGFGSAGPLLNPSEPRIPSPAATTPTPPVPASTAPASPARSVSPMDPFHDVQQLQGMMTHAQQQAVDALSQLKERSAELVASKELIAQQLTAALALEERVLLLQVMAAGKDADIKLLQEEVWRLKESRNCEDCAGLEEKLSGESLVVLFFYYC